MRQAREAWKAERQPKMRLEPHRMPVIQGSGPAGVFDYGAVTTSNGTFAYLRFWSFRANAVDDLVNALAPILGSLPQNGLIFDMRANTGGYIAAGERVLQLFSAQPIVGIPLPKAA